MVYFINLGALNISSGMSLRRILLNAIREQSYFVSGYKETPLTISLFLTFR